MGGKMKKRRILRRVSVLFIVSALILTLGVGALAAQLSGAIFTTTVDGAIVNENVHYEAKVDVYLDGGPGPNARSQIQAVRIYSPVTTFPAVKFT